MPGHGGSTGAAEARRVQAARSSSRSGALSVSSSAPKASTRRAAPAWPWASSSSASASSVAGFTDCAPSVSARSAPSASSERASSSSPRRVARRASCTFSQPASAIRPAPCATSSAASACVRAASTSSTFSASSVRLASTKARLETRPWRSLSCSASCRCTLRGLVVVHEGRHRGQVVQAQRQAGVVAVAAMLQQRLAHQAQRFVVAAEPLLAEREVVERRGDLVRPPARLRQRQHLLVGLAGLDEAAGEHRAAAEHREGLEPRLARLAAARGGQGARRRRLGFGIACEPGLHQRRLAEQERLQRGGRRPAAIRWPAGTAPGLRRSGRDARSS